MKKRGRRRIIKGHLRFLLIVMIGILCFLGGTVAYWKIVHGEEFETEAKQQQVSRYDYTISPNRGQIVDRNNQPLAVSTRVYTVVMDVRVLFQFKDDVKEKTVNALCKNLGLDHDTLMGYLAEDPKNPGNPVLDTNYKILAKQVDPKIKEKIESEGVKGVVFEDDIKRKYPAGSLASSVIGFKSGNFATGLEKQYDEQMSGVAGRSFITYDGERGAVHQEVPAQDGDKIVTTVDYTLQTYAEDAVKEGMSEYNPENAACVIMNPKTGEILAMASAPSFDPNDPYKKPDSVNDDKWKSLDNNGKSKILNSVWKNFCISSTFEPGSVFKPCVASAAIEEGVIKNSSTFYCGGSLNVAGSVIHCHLRSGHGNLTVEGIIAQSCNVGMMQIAAKMGASLFYKYQKDYGVGSLTGIDLPDEVSADSLMYKEKDIGPVQLATMSFGQSFNTTTVQVLNAVASVVNGGNLMRPYIVSQIVDPNGNIVKETKPEIIRKVLSKETSDIMRKDMIATVEYGTGKKAKIEGYTFGGKTGTAQQAPRSEGKYTVSYIAFIPGDDPQYIAITLIHKPEKYADGVTTVSPITKELMEKIIKYENIEPSYETSKTATPEKTQVTVPNYVGCSLFDALSDIDELGLKYKVIGNGNKITKQVPDTNTAVDTGTEVLIYVEKSKGETADIAVPDVSGLSYNEAMAKIEASGLTCKAEGNKTDGVVLKTNPVYGVRLNDGGEVTLSMGKASDENDNGKTDNTQ
ncbi:MAG: PASTA domain-containing protein [Clostridia bacterium]|jgi:stage V sporulation protein D (sporulation-specific penicillin-binding protein)|nr:PASTA domain-containing protein [Clostridia bacterium]MCI1999626.1 PASTA domain-containing protein [Clostridia bacterium]MCI2013995.1 PASTA domain-containing protein [Clostridia bacterium]